jgi:hypothetical protein
VGEGALAAIQTEHYLEALDFAARRTGAGAAAPGRGPTGASGGAR